MSSPVLAEPQSSLAAALFAAKIASRSVHELSSVVLSSSVFTV
jgi:hypothetical protein